MSDLNQQLRQTKRGRPRLDHEPQGTRDGRLQDELLVLLTNSIPGSQTKGWRQAILQAFSDAEEVQEAEDDFESFLLEFKYIPDAYVIARDEMRIDFFEVEITSLMTNTKLQAYAEFKTIMDFYGIEFALYSVNQHGHINEVGLLGHYINWLKANQP